MQVKQSILALGSVEFLGRALACQLKNSDFAAGNGRFLFFAIFGEETGNYRMRNSNFVIFGFIWLGFKIAKSSNRQVFQSYLQSALSHGFAVQAFINIASASGIFPLSGIPLPIFFLWRLAHCFRINRSRNIIKHSKK